MADSRNTNGGGGRHLDATGAREVVYCHQCENEWYRDEHGLVCPACEGEIIEIVNPNSDPRPGMNHSPDMSPLRDLHDHNPWADDSDPEEADIEEHITHGPGGSILFSQTIRTGGIGAFGGATNGGRRRRSPGGDEGEDETMRDFHSIIGNILGPNMRGGRVGRSGHDDLFPRAGEFHMGGGPGPAIVGERYTFEGRFENGRLRPRDANGPQAQGAPVEDLATLITQLFTQMGAGPAGAAGEDGEARRAGMLPGAMGLPGLLQSLLNHPNAIHGDAVYSQEHFDRIISQLMEQHQHSNAPGPAPPDAISALPKKALDEKLLGPEGKGECSVCMDDVFLGTEVVVLPCSHWFHEACASAWLSEHNTCPICRKGIGAEEAPSSSRHADTRGSSNSPNGNSPNSPTSRRSRFFRSNEEHPSRMARNEARLEAIRTGRLMSPPLGSSSSQRTETERQAERAAERAAEDLFATPSPRVEHMPGFFPGNASTPTPPTLVRRDSATSSGANEQRRGVGSPTSSFSRERPRSERSGSDSSVRGEGNGNAGLSGWIRDRWGRRQE
ncbi:hypothetical protein DSL72_005141 [Monilinia vaccinii-corymbosi]|uniref:RING-type E3 ubiquitin transferase n=1 Tax=Monilinia vaccinii-corymbosi TaxID=61207 RepID=A0A8A3PET6_9HELO|nr:hypothetical protein DSL72_005141 [Monilinia vaccinii-corymbosi]